MAWMGIIGRKCWPVYRSVGSASEVVYALMLDAAMSAVRALTVHGGYWFGLNSSRLHVASALVNFLNAKSGDRLISYLLVLGMVGYETSLAAMQHWLNMQSDPKNRHPQLKMVLRPNFQS